VSILGAPPPNALTVAFLDSGQGDCTLIVSPKGQLILVDCGSIKNSSVVLPGVVEVLKRYLPAAKNTIHTLVLTHPDQDHYNMLADAMNATGANVTNVWFGGDREQYQNKLDKNRVYNWLVQRNAQPFGNSVYGGNSTPLDFDGVKVFVLAANASGNRSADDGWRVNTNSIVLMLYYANYKVFLMGDATSDTEAFILQSVKASGPAAILTNEYASSLKMGHHGSTTSSSEAWVKAVKPNGIFISADTRVFSGTGMPKRSQLNNVVTWSGNVQSGIPSHGVVVFDDTLSTPRFDVLNSTQVVCSTLHSILYNLLGTAYDAAGLAWYLFVGSNGAVEVSSTG
jgi:beta-lactamase superfamily II metal-dependent hydrolase